MKEMQLLMGERYPPGINCLGIENLSCLFENEANGGDTLWENFTLLSDFLWFECLALEDFDEK